MKSLARLSPGLRQDKGGQCGNSAHTWSQEARCGGQAQPSPPRCLEHQLWASRRQTLCTHTAVLGFIDKDVGAQRGFLHWLTPGLIEGLPRCALPRVGEWSVEAGPSCSHAQPRLPGARLLKGASGCVFYTQAVGDKEMQQETCLARAQHVTTTQKMPAAFLTMPHEPRKDVLCCRARARDLASEASGHV
ncbi:hypothetical protein MJG53_009332 [Ovis ammon polii x Ovis aries]|uniref:Uncharacterized protein n=1 Tax=Ovis ammon polii x Ovis aries TaxID=2918886 RepID=A0ACB9UW30_9CETA|nr:hypothetical protein MJG53_009332 [Ovis ammon polii x Ovis aries]